MSKRKPEMKQKWYTEKDAHGASSKFGQMIGEAFADSVLKFIESYLDETYSDYVLLEPEEGIALLRLEMFGGTSRQLDNVIAFKDSDDPVALFESKWLKDARHHNDKGAWILQLKEIRKKYPTVRGAAATLAGYWTAGVGVMFQSEAGVRMVHVATDEEVYGTLQKSVTQFMKKHGLSKFTFNVNQIRGSLPRSWDLANCLMELKDSGELSEIAQGWLGFMRKENEQGKPIFGGDLVKEAIDFLLSPIPEQPSIAKLEIALQIDTGNTIYQEFSDLEEALHFIQNHFQNPRAILDKITPKKKSK